MGFEVNFNNKPMITEAQSMHDGGAGNLGYFESEKKKNKEKSIFSEAQEKDSFEKQGEEESGFNVSSILDFIEKFILAIKNWFKKLFNLD